MTTDERLRLTLVSELDQLTAGLDRGDKARHPARTQDVSHRRP